MTMTDVLICDDCNKPGGFYVTPCAHALCVDCYAKRFNAAKQRALELAGSESETHNT